MIWKYSKFTFYLRFFKNIKSKRRMILFLYFLYIFLENSKFQRSIKNIGLKSFLNKKKINGKNYFLFSLEKILSSKFASDLFNFDNKQARHGRMRQRAYRLFCWLIRNWLENILIWKIINLKNKMINHLYFHNWLF